MWSKCLEGPTFFPVLRITSLRDPTALIVEYIFVRLFVNQPSKSTNAKETLKLVPLHQ